MLLSGHPDLITLVNKGFMIYLKYFVSIRIKNDLSIFKRWEIHLTLCFNFPVSWRSNKLRELIYVYSLLTVSCHFLRHRQKQYHFCKSAWCNFLLVLDLSGQSRVGEMGQSFRSSGQSEYRTCFIFSKGAANHNIILLH